MASYQLIILCSHQIYELFVTPNMSRNEIIENIRSYFKLNQDSFHVQIYDERFHDYIDFDDEYVEELQERLPRTYTTKLNIKVMCYNPSDHEEISEQPGESISLDDMILSRANFDSALTDISVLDNLAIPQQCEQSVSNHNSEIDLSISNNVLIPKNDETFLLEDSYPLSRIAFTHDISPYQRDRYQCDILYKGEKIQVLKNNYVSRVQGVRNYDQKHTSVLPEIKIPSKYVKSNQFQLIIAIVTEERNKDIATWYLHKEKGFLPAGTDTDTSPVNPLIDNIQRLELTQNGSFRLKLRMVQTYRKGPIGRGKIFKILPLSVVENLHPSRHKCNTPRLICVIANVNNNILWETLGLSDFFSPYTLKCRLEKSKRSTKKSPDLKDSSSIIGDERYHQHIGT